ncbi:hypothetical protein [Sulfurovum sp.]|uniref:hypothetical protein n=1 Tax=Sulfurovum sp. TaxID=1969726 RepID=UPI0025CCB01F|nr:hypothetical protein [Sulfurovum sp.]
MTAPLYLSRSKKSVSLHVIINKLLNAIDNDEIAKVKKHMDTVLKHFASWELLLMLSNYAKETEQPLSYTYLQQIIETTYNLSKGENR